MNTSQAPAIATEAELHNRAAEIVEAFDSHNAILARIATFDQETADKTRAFDNQIATADSGGFDDTAGIQRGLVLKEQRQRYVEQRAKEREAFVSTTNRLAREAVEHLDIPAFFANALRAERARVIGVLNSMMETEGRSASMSANVDSISSLSYWATNLSRTIPGPGIASRLRAFVLGEKVIWRI